jgi:hypothetical protein
MVHAALPPPFLKCWRAAADKKPNVGLSDNTNWKEVTIYNKF